MNEHSDVQIAAIAKFEQLKVGALFMEMGTGKTRVALDLMASRASKCDFFVWVCPCALKVEIERERLKWHPELSISVIGCESIGSSERIYDDLKEEIESHQCTFMVIDESLKIKNRCAKRTARLCRLSHLTKYRLILNGTPISRDISDLWTQMYFLSPKILDCSYSGFLRKYCDFEVIQGRGMRITGQRNIEHLTAKIAPYVFESKLYLDVDRETHQHTYYICEDEYRHVKDEIISSFELDECEDIGEIDFYTLITKLQRWYTSQISHYAAINSCINELDGEQCVVFVKFIDTIPKGASCITGEMKTVERESVIKRFKDGDIQTLWITYGLGAYGLNLQNAHHVIFAEHAWDYAQRVQAEARVYRIGQTETVHVHDIVCANAGLESLILRNIGKKARTADGVTRAISKLKDML